MCHKDTTPLKSHLPCLLCIIISLMNLSDAQRIIPSHFVVPYNGAIKIIYSLKMQRNEIPSRRTKNSTMNMSSHPLAGSFISKVNKQTSGFMMMIQRIINCTNIIPDNDEGGKFFFILCVYNQFYFISFQFPVANRYCDVYQLNLPRHDSADDFVILNQQKINVRQQNEK